MQIDFITIVHAQDLPHWRLQAKSFARYLSPEAPARIFVVANDARGRESFNEISANLAAYGPHRDRVMVLDGPKLLQHPRALTGWRRQQALKLIVGGVGAADGLIWLDGKNHFLGPVNADSFFTDTGLARTIYTQKKRRHDRRWLRHSLDYFGQPQSLLEDLGPLTYTPYPMRRYVLADMLADIAERGSSPEALFRRATPYTEFYLLYAFVMQRFGSLDAVYSPTLRWPATIWKNGPSAGEGIRRHLERFERLGGPFFAVHQSRFGTFIQQDWDALAALWRDRDLLDEAEITAILGPVATPKQAARLRPSRRAEFARRLMPYSVRAWAEISYRWARLLGR